MTIGLRMRLCGRHLNALRDAIGDRGLGEEYAKTDQELNLRLQHGIDDPLIIGVKAIVSNAAKFPVELLEAAKTTSHPCPICVLRFGDWIERAADDAKRIWERKKTPS